MSRRRERLSRTHTKWRGLWHFKLAGKRVERYCREEGGSCCEGSLGSTNNAICEVLAAGSYLVAGE